MSKFFFIIEIVFCILAIIFAFTKMWHGWLYCTLGILIMGAWSTTFLVLEKLQNIERVMISLFDTCLSERVQSDHTENKQSKE